jgi:hypothetical protein
MIQERIDEIKARVEGFKAGNQESAVMIVRVDIPFLFHVIEGQSKTMDALREENSRLKSRGRCRTMI